MFEPGNLYERDFRLEHYAFFTSTYGLYYVFKERETTGRK